MTRTGVTKLLMLMAMMCCLSVAALAQRDDRSLSCNDNDWNDGRKSHCEIKEQTISASGPVSVDARKNGGISIKGWERKEVLVRAKIQASAPTEDEAVSIARAVSVETAGAQIRADGPATSRDRQWSVSYEIFVPRQSDLSLKAHNGGIGINGVTGRIEFETVNGGVSLKELGGSVKGTTTNGGVSVVLSGNRWDGEGLDVKTTNGGVSLAIPENYSARLETGTVNGGMNLGIPLTMEGEIKRELSVDLGSGGSPLRVRTTNGGISIKRRA
ncbi:MAG: DUF4097 family beta strand repeat-containing protein [Blastocatellia bacterium]